MPVSTSQLLWAFNLYVPTVMVAALATGSEVAWFGSSLRIVVSLNTFIWLYFFNLYPTLVENAGKPYDSTAWLMERSFRLTAWIGVLGGLLGTVLAEPLCSLAYGSEFSQAGKTFAILVWVLPISLLSGHARFSLIAYGDQKREAFSASVGSVATLALGAVLIPALGASGAATAMVGAAILVWLLAQRFALETVGPLPLISPVWRPVMAAVVSAVVIRQLPDGTVWLDGLVALATYCVMAVLLDGSLRRDLRAIVGR